MTNTSCRECHRPITLTVPRQARICTECHNRVTAEAALAEDGLDAAERESIVSYIAQMKDAAIAKGGRFEGSAVRVLKPVRENAYLPPEPGAKRSTRAALPKPPKPAKPKRAEPPKRPRGRPVLPENARMVMLGFRVPPETRDKLMALGGRDWLILAVARAAPPRHTDEDKPARVHATA